MRYAEIEMKTPVLRLAPESNQNSLCGFYRGRYRVEGELHGQVFSITKAADE